MVLFNRLDVADLRVVVHNLFDLKLVLAVRQMHHDFLHLFLLLLDLVRVYLGVELPQLVELGLDSELLLRYRFQKRRLVNKRNLPHLQRLVVVERHQRDLLHLIVLFCGDHHLEVRYRNTNT